MIAGKSQQEEKFISVYRAQVDEVYQFVYLRTGANTTAAEDLTQEIFLEVYKSLPRFKALSSERTWVFQIAKNRLNDYYRRQYRSIMMQDCIDDIPDARLIDAGQDIQELQIKAFTQAAVRACLSALPKQYEIVLTLKYVDGRKTKEIAALFGKSPKAIEGILHRAKDAFIRQYTEIEKKGAL